MKTIFTLTVMITAVLTVFAQAPQRMSYQCIVRNTTGGLVANHAIGMRISILQGSASGTAVYVETQQPTTNANGLATIEIGGGSVVSGTFTGINWGSGIFYIKTETDPAGGTSYSITGISQILSVPYALYSQLATTANDAVKLTGDQTISGNKTFTGTITGNLNANNNVISNIANPVSGQDAVTKAYLHFIINEIYGNFELGCDIENNLYHIIKLGEQTWFKENLKTTKYNDGTEIFCPGANNSEWSSNTTGAYAWYNNDPTANKDLYGVLYNGYAVSTGKLCPVGWHVPTDAEWTILENYLIANGYNYDGTTSGNKIAKSLASTSGWNYAKNAGVPGSTDNSSYRNKSNFTALPVGFRGTNGNFEPIGTIGHWWSSTEYNSTNLYHRDIRYDRTNTDRMYHSKSYGFSVRCIKD